jgi:hypothetical protein
MKAGPTTVNVKGPATSIRDDKYHTVQIVRSADVLRVIVDGVSGTPTSVATFGITSSGATYIGVVSGYHQGSINYVRIDAEALTDARLAYEQQILSGIAAGTTWGASMDYARAGTAYQTFSDGTMALRPSGAPRVGDGVLIEGAGTNLLTYTGAFSTDWTKSGTCTIAGTSVVLPDGTTGTTNTFHEGTDAATTHLASHSAGAKSIGISYCFSLYLKYNPAAGTPREWVRLYIDDSSKSSSRYFNIRHGTLGTSVGNASVRGSTIEPIGNGWFRAHVWLTAETAATGTAYLIVAEADNDATFTGQNQDSVFIFGPQIETGSLPTSYTPNATTSTANGRPADDLSIPTYRLRNTLKDIVSTTPTMWLDFDVDPSGATIVDKSGAYTLTKAGQPKRYTSAVYGDYHLFNGTADYYSSASADFTPAGNFSVSTVFTPTTVSGTHVIAGRRGTAGQRSWYLYQSNATVNFAISNNGTVDVECTVSAALVAGKPVQVTASYSTTAGSACRVDALTASTTPNTGAVSASTAAFMVGETTSGAGKFAGKLHYLAYYAGTVISDVQHAAMYAALKLPGVLPVSVGSAAHYSKIRVRGEYKAIAASQSGVLFDIGGGIGASDADTNRLTIDMTTTTLRASIYANGESTQRFMSKTGMTQNAWNTFDFIFPMADLTGGTGLVNGAAATLDATMTGAKTLSLLDTWVKVGCDYAVANPANAQIKYLDVYIGND